MSVGKQLMRIAGSFMSRVSGLLAFGAALTGKVRGL
jgi:hypothetical protein